MPLPHAALDSTSGHSHGPGTFWSSQVCLPDRPLQLQIILIPGAVQVGESRLRVFSEGGGAGAEHAHTSGYAKSKYVERSKFLTCQT
jgi:hypothetical protein